MKKEKEIKLIEIELDLEQETIDRLIEHAKKNIVNDKQALIDWSVNDILLQIVTNDKNKGKVKKATKVKKIKKGKNNGTRKSNS